MEFPHFALIQRKTWLPWMVLVSDWLIHLKISSETAWPNVRCATQSQASAPLVLITKGRCQ